MKIIYITLIIICFSLANAVSYVDSLETILPDLEGTHKYEVLRGLTIVSRTTNKPKSLLYAFQQQLVAEELGVGSYQFDAQQNLAIALNLNEFYLASQAEIEELLIKLNASKQEEQAALFNLISGDIYLDLNDSRKAEAAYYRALDYYQNKKDKTNIAFTFQKLADLEFTKKNYESSNYYMDSAIMLYRDKKQMLKLANSSKQYAKYLLAQKKYEDATWNSQKARSEFEKKTQISQMVDALMVEADISLEFSGNKEITKSLLRVLKLMRGAKDEKNRARILIKLLELPAARNIHQNYLQELESILDSVPNNDLTIEFKRDLLELYKHLGIQHKIDLYQKMIDQRKAELNYRDQQSWLKLRELLESNNNRIETEVAQINRKIMMNSIFSIVAIIFAIGWFIIIIFKTKQ